VVVGRFLLVCDHPHSSEKVLMGLYYQSHSTEAVQYGDLKPLTQLHFRWRHFFIVTIADNHFCVLVQNEELDVNIVEKYNSEFQQKRIESSMIDIVENLEKLYFL
jgi:hypothetical protein